MPRYFLRVRNRWRVQSPRGDLLERLELHPLRYRLRVAERPALHANQWPTPPANIQAAAVDMLPCFALLWIYWCRLH